jgi:hypothetical protein
VIFPDRVEHVLLAFHERGHLAAVLLVDRPCFRHETGDAPAVAVALDHQIDQAEMRPPETAHGGRFAEQGALFGVHARQAFVLRTREDQVVVPGEDRVDTVDGGQMQGGVLHALAEIVGVDAGMGQGDDQIAALFAHFRNESLRGGDDVAGIRAIFQVAAVPVHDLRRDEADEPDPDRMAVAGPRR